MFHHSHADTHLIALDAERFPAVRFMPEPAFENAEYRVRITHTLGTDKRIMSFVNYLWGFEVTGGYDQWEPLTIVDVSDNDCISGVGAGWLVGVLIIGFLCSGEAKWLRISRRHATERSHCAHQSHVCGNADVARSTAADSPVRQEHQDLCARVRTQSNDSWGFSSTNLCILLLEMKIRSRMTNSPSTIGSSCVSVTSIQRDLTTNRHFSPSTHSSPGAGSRRPMERLLPVERSQQAALPRVQLLPRAVQSRGALLSRNSDHR